MLPLCSTCEVGPIYVLTKLAGEIGLTLAGNPEMEVQLDRPTVILGKKLQNHAIGSSWVADVWRLKFGTSLELGAWDLVFRQTFARNGDAPPENS